MHLSIFFLGMTGVYTGLRNHARKFSLFLGILLLAVGILFFVPGISDLLIRLLNVNRAVAMLNIVIGIAAILFALLTPRPAAPGSHTSDARSVLK